MKILNYEIAQLEIHGAIDSSYFEAPANVQRAILAEAVLSALEANNEIQLTEQEVPEEWPLEK